MIARDNDESAPLAKVGPLLRYVQDNPLATVASVMILGVLLARFAFLGNAKE